MAIVEQYPYVEKEPALGETGKHPFLPVMLSYNGKSLVASAIVDSGSTVNVLPYSVGFQLGAVWDNQRLPVPLAGLLADQEARALLLTAHIGKFPANPLAFAWTKVDSCPFILGQVNFFMEFDVCFFRSRSVFELKQKSIG